MTEQTRTKGARQIFLTVIVSVSLILIIIIGLVFYISPNSDKNYKDEVAIKDALEHVDEHIDSASSDLQILQKLVENNAPSDVIINYQNGLIEHNEHIISNLLEANYAGLEIEQTDEIAEFSNILDSQLTMFSAISKSKANNFESLSDKLENGEEFSTASTQIKDYLKSQIIQ